MDRIPKIFVINLPNRTDRLASITAELESMGLLDKMEIVEGVIIHAHGTGTPGIAQAHARCLELAKERGYEMVMILEDDCKFLVDKERFKHEIETFLNTVPSFWNGLWFGSLNDTVPIRAFPNSHHAHGFNQDTATLIHACFYDQLIETYYFCRDKYIETGDSKYNIDSWMSGAIPVYFSKPRLCGQADNYSDRTFQIMYGGHGRSL